MGKPLSSFKQKVEWLRKHPDLWREWPKYDAVVERNIILAMRKDGLVSAKTHDGGIMDFGKLITAARSRTHTTIFRTVVVGFWRFL